MKLSKLQRHSYHKEVNIEVEWYLDPAQSFVFRSFIMFHWPEPNLFIGWLSDICRNASVLCRVTVQKKKKVKKNEFHNQSLYLLTNGQFKTILCRIWLCIDYNYNNIHLLTRTLYYMLQMKHQSTKKLVRENSLRELQTINRI